MRKQKRPNKPDLKGFEFEPQMTFDQIADSLQITQQAVIEIYNRAMHKLIEELRNSKARK